MNLEKSVQYLSSFSKLYFILTQIYIYMCTVRRYTSNFNKNYYYFLNRILKFALELHILIS